MSALGGPERAWNALDDEAALPVADDADGGAGLLGQAIPLPRVADHVPSNVIPLRPAADRHSPVARLPVATEERTRADGLGRRTSAWIPEWPAVLVGACVIVALGLALTGSLRAGCLALAAAVGLGALLRVWLGDSGAGLLRSRSRGTDLVMMGVLAASLLALAWGIPAPG